VEEHRDLPELRDAIPSAIRALYRTRRSSRRPTPDEANVRVPGELAGGEWIPAIGFLGSGHSQHLGL